MSKRFPDAATRRRWSMLSRLHWDMAEWMLRCECTIYCPQDIAGRIAAYQLVPWWHECIPHTDKRRAFESEACRMLSWAAIYGDWHEGFRNWFRDTLVVGECLPPLPPPWDYLLDAASLFSRYDHRHLSRQFVQCGLEILFAPGTRQPNAESRYSSLLSALGSCYHETADDETVDLCISICQRMIEIFPRWYDPDRPPHLRRHRGYEQLAIIYANRHQYPEAIEVCRQAAVHNWPGDWDKRIQRYQRKQQ